MKNNFNAILSFSIKKASLLTIVAASTLVVACKKDAKEASVEQLSANAGSKNAVAVAAAVSGSGWSELTSSIESTQRIHLENFEGNGLKTRSWNAGAAWYLNAAESTSGSSYGSNNVASYTYSASNNKRNTFTLHRAPGNRSEIRIQDDYGVGDIRQFEGIVTINSGVFASNAVFQIWGGIVINGQQRATLLQIRGDGSVNGGQLRVVPNGVTNEVGSRTIATNILNTPTTINVIHFQEIASRPGRVVIYVNGDEVYSCEESQVPSNNSTNTNYMKYGNYGREDEDASRTNSVVTWSNVRYWEIPKVTVRQGCNYTGWSASLSVGDYTLSQLQALGFVNDDASSLRVPAGLRVRVYANNNFDTLIGTFTSDQSCFSSTVNDRISSIRVEQVQ
jgi:hypothetical protein